MKRTAALWLVFFAVTTAARAQQRPAITGIAFARFYTTHADEAERFYGQTLGFERRDDGGVWVYPVNREQWIEVLDATPRQSNVRMAAVGFTTADAAGLERYLQAHGVTAEVPLEEGQFAVRDPEGNLVVFVQKGSEKLVATAAESPRATSHRVLHVGFLVDDRAKEDEFWVKLLGFRPYWHGGGKEEQTDWVSLQVPDGRDWLEYMLHHTADPTLKEAGSSDHFSLGVEHMQDAIAALERNGCESEACRTSKVGRDGKVQLNLFDPDMTRVEFMEYVPAEKPCCSAFTAPHPGAADYGAAGAAGAAATQH